MAWNRRLVHGIKSWLNLLFNLDFFIANVITLFSFTRIKMFIYVLMYENSILITSSSSMLVHKIIDYFHDKFALKKLDILEYFIGIKILHLASWNLFLTQTKCICDLLTKSNMINANGVTTPMLRNYRLDKHGVLSLSDPYLYRSMVEALKYVTLTRPDITFIVNKACQFMVSPLDTLVSSKMVFEVPQWCHQSWLSSFFFSIIRENISLCL